VKVFDAGKTIMIGRYVKPFSSDTGTYRYSSVEQMDGQTDGRMDRQIYYINIVRTQ